MKAKGANLQKAVFLKLCREFNLPQPVQQVPVLFADLQLGLVCPLFHRPLDQQ